MNTEDTPQSETTHGRATGFHSVAGRAEQSPLAAYRDLVIGRPGFGAFLRHELSMLAFGMTPGATGLALRRLCFRGLFAACGRKVTFGVGLTLRQPGSMTLGAGCFLDDFVSLSARGRDAAIELEPRVFLGRGSILTARDGAIRIGEQSNISSQCRLGIENGTIAIGRQVLIAAFTYVGGGRHRIDRTDVPIMEQGGAARGGVTIEDDVWIGAGAMVMDGVRIGKGAVIGARSLVTQDIPPMSVAYGSPAQVVRQRGETTSSS